MAGPIGMDMVVVAAGRSTRMRGIDKVFVPVNGVPLLAYSLERFQASPLVSSVVVVVSDTNLNAARDLVESRGLTKARAVVTGGIRRQDSVRNGLEAVGGDWVGVHDGARPFVDEAILERGLKAVEATGAAIAAVPVRDTIKQVGHAGQIESTPPRERLWAAQTPQIFRRELLLRAHRELGGEATDDASMVEQLGGKVVVFEGSPWNMKVTTPEDLVIAEAIAGYFKRGTQAAPERARAQHRHAAFTVPSAPGPTDAPIEAIPGLSQGLRRPGAQAGVTQSKEVVRRYGTGFDGHRLTEGGPLRLGGVDIPFDLHLEGHSDGDVVLHAVASSILGGAGVGDLGRHFPSSDPSLKGVDSRVLLRRTAALARDAGWLTEFVDATIIAQRPKLAPYLDAIGRTIAETLGVEPSRVNVKATSTDQVGAIGQGDGIAAQAIATVRSI